MHEVVRYLKTYYVLSRSSDFNIIYQIVIFSDNEFFSQNELDLYLHLKKNV